MKYIRICIGSLITGHMSSEVVVVASGTPNSSQSVEQVMSGAATSVAHASHTGVDPVVVNVGDSAPDVKKDVVVHPRAQPNTFPYPAPPVDVMKPGNAAKTRRGLLAGVAKQPKIPKLDTTVQIALWKKLYAGETSILFAVSSLVWSFSERRKTLAFGLRHSTMSGTY